MPGQKDVTFPVDLHHELRLQAATQVRDTDQIIVEAVQMWLESSDGGLEPRQD